MINAGFILSLLAGLLVYVLREFLYGIVWELMVWISAVIVSVAILYGRMTARYKKVLGDILDNIIMRPEEIPSLFPIRLPRIRLTKRNMILIVFLALFALFIMKVWVFSRLS